MPKSCPGQDDLCDPATGTKNWEIRCVQMIPDMRRLPDRIKGEREDFAANPNTRVHECQGWINRARRLLNITQFLAQNQSAGGEAFIDILGSTRETSLVQIRRAQYWGF